MSVLILIVDDEEDVELLFRQRFRHDLKAGRFVMPARRVSSRRSLFLSSAFSRSAALMGNRAPRPVSCRPRWPR